MLESEKFAIAAHLHVTLRRTNGRVTDVEWMVKSPEYAREIIRVARTETHPDLLRLADKLEAALQPVALPARLAVAAGSPGRASDFMQTQPPTTNPGFTPEGPGGRKRYVGSLR